MPHCVNPPSRDIRIHLEGDAEQLEQADQDLRTSGGESWSIGIGRYSDRAEMCRVLASWVDDEDRALPWRTEEDGGMEVPCACSSWALGSAG